MFNIGDYLKKFSKLSAESSLIRGAISSALADACGGAKVPFELDRGIVYIQGVPGAVRSLVFMNKRGIIDAIHKAAPGAKVRDIR